VLKGNCRKIWISSDRSMRMTLRKAVALAVLPTMVF
jgi:hypothetical protein